MPDGNDHHRKEPTQRRSSDSRGRISGNVSARPHDGHSSAQQGQRQSLADQLLSAAREQSGGNANAADQRQSLSDQLLEAAREQQAGNQGGGAHGTQQSQWTGSARPDASHYASANDTGRQTIISPSPTSATQTSSRPKLLVPLAIIFALLLGVGGLGGSCMSGGGDLFGSGSSGGFNTSGGTGSSGNYTINSNLGAGNAEDSWTVLLYLCGSNLESQPTRLGGGLATSNLIELTQADLGSNVNFVIETGGAQRWQNDVVSARYLERYAMEGGYMTQKERVRSASMAEPSTLADFLSWGTKNYPADHYMLVFWDHGGGSITGVCNDDLYPYTSKGEADSLTLPEIREALKASGTQFEVVGFDTCLMATLETAETLAPYSNYMVASEETEPGTGWDYTAWPTWLAQHPGTSGADLGTVICQTYYNKCANVNAANTATLSTIDLSKIKAVSTAFRNASDDIAFATVDSSSLRKLYQGAGKSESYGNDGSLFSASLNMVDLADLMNKTRDVIGQDADAVVKAVQDAVVFQAHGRNRAQASGLSVFYPLQTSDRNDFYKYVDISSNTPYLQFLGVMYGVYDKYDWTQFDNYVSLHGEPVNEDNVQIAFDQTVNRDGHVQLNITQGINQVAQVQIEMYISLAEIDTLCLIGTDNDLNGSYESGQFTDNFQNDWLAIDGNYVCAVLTEQGNGYNLYYVPVNVNGERTGLLVEYDFSTNEFGVICAWDENDADTGMAGRTGRLLENGDEVQFLFPSLNTSTGEQGTIALGTMTWHDDPVIGYEDLGDGTFAFRYAITDILGNEQKSELVFESYANGKYVG